MSYRPVLVSSLFLFLFAVVGSGLVAYTHENTVELIHDNERRALLKSLNELIPTDRYDNDIFHDILYVRHKDLLGTAKPVPVYRARKNGWPVAAVLAPVAPDGYNGNIRLLVAIKLDGTLAGVRVVQHRETPGLGDGIETSNSDWILGFNGKSLENPGKEGWKVKRDGGQFDQFTGATITPRAVVKAVRNALLYYQIHGHELFEEHPGDTTGK
ncbi:electron transport complex protein RnfG [Thiogranum longum]|uniref:Ion-translocating oxidoreductase complex subunit G n=1 Tax=Thiogranum longum TaxID=1537524 RepID=A0A4R1HND4_9GAMM|nr:electron transport complex subunit RsxG [Thiogranum longum]TCK18772.1 electron transport complex protein RnfG [Thiogranum longum]